LKKHFIAKVVAGHRVTVPKEVCQVLGIKDGDLVEVDLDVAKIPQESENKPERGK
jgi:bifunctional DNA-binding transcriptional regulator/antitoxin component of YhaV-PrlF toxin-antitoxin module